jgi:hypothetical protein
MSHFAVAVISKTPDIEQLLAPYQENNMDNCPKSIRANMKQIALNV